MTSPAVAPVDPRRRRRLGIALIGLVVVALVALYLAWDWNWFKASVERRIERATGRSFEIAGNFDVDPGLFALTVRGSDVHLGNADWSKVAEMAKADEVELELRLWPLIAGHVVITRARLEKPTVRLERIAEHPGNWVFRRGKGGRFEIGELRVGEGTLVVLDAPSRTDLNLTLDSRPARRDDARQPLAIDGSGRFRGFDFDIQGRVESPLELRDGGEPYWINLNARAGSTRAHARGRMRTMARLDHFDLDLELTGQDLSHLDALFGIVLPPTPPYALDGRLVRDEQVWSYREFTGRVGDSDLAGDAVLTLGGERPHLKAELESDKLDFDDLAGFIGAPPSTDPGESASAQQKQDGAALAGSARVLPQKPYDASSLQRMDADVRLVAARVDAGPLPLESLDASLHLDAGVAKLDPLNLGVAGGRIESIITLDASTTPIKATADLTLRRLSLPKLFPGAELTEDSSGRIGGRIKLKGRGDSIAAMLASAGGDIGLVMGRGRISNLLLELAGLDVAEALRFMIGKDRIVPLRCAHADFAVADGVMTTRSFVFDTTDTVLYGEGTVDLRDESFDLVLKPQPKDRSLVSLRSPLKVQGTFKDPDIAPQGGPLLLRGLAAVALYAMAPPAALLALAETGPGEDSDCLRPDSAQVEPEAKAAAK